MSNNVTSTMYYESVKRNWSNLIYSFDDDTKIICIQMTTSNPVIMKYKIVEETRECWFLGSENVVTGHVHSKGFNISQVSNVSV